VRTKFNSGPHTKAVITLENKQIRSYALEPAGSFFLRCWTLFSDGV
jgi:hypothetical protein